MNINQDSTMPTFYIYRDGPAGEPFDPTSPLQFFPSKDSDELFFALRNAYPHVQTHSERMRNAVIQFLLTEGQSQQAIQSTQNSPPMPMETSLYDSSSASPRSSYLSLNSSSSSSASPSACDATSPPTSQLQRSSSSASTSQPQSGLDQMTSVFSLTTKAAPKLRSRRKMTEAEKVEYRQRRNAGACDLCSARKRKCKHNKPLPASSKPASKTMSKKSQGKQPAETGPPPQSTRPLAPAPQFTLTTPEISLLDTSFDLLDHDLMSFDNELFPWTADTDWTLLDTPATHHAFPQTNGHLQDTSHYRSDLTPQLFGANITTMFDAVDNQFGLEGARPSQLPTHTFHANAAQALGASSSTDGVDDHSRLQALQSTTSSNSASAGVLTAPRLRNPLLHATLTSGDVLASSSERDDVRQNVTSGLSANAGLSGGFVHTLGSQDNGSLHASYDALPRLASGGGLPLGIRTRGGLDTLQSPSSNANTPVSSETTGGVGRGDVDGGHSFTPGLATVQHRPGHIPFGFSPGVLSFTDARAAASVKDRQSLTHRDSGQTAAASVAGIQRGEGNSPSGDTLPTAGVAQQVPRAVVPVHTRSTNPRSSALGDGILPNSSASRKPSSPLQAPPVAPSSSPAAVQTSSSAASAPLSPGQAGGSFAGLSLEDFLLLVGEVQKCLMCAMIATLPAVRLPVDTGLGGGSAFSPRAMDELAGMCAGMQIAVG